VTDISTFVVAAGAEIESGPVGARRPRLACQDIVEKLERVFPKGSHELVCDKRSAQVGQSTRFDARAGKSQPQSEERFRDLRGHARRSGFGPRGV